MSPPPVTAPVIVTLPAAPPSNVRSLPPVPTVELNKILPAPVPVSISTSPLNVTAWLNVMLSSDVTISPAVLILPDPLVKLTAPAAFISANAPIVIAPAAPLPSKVSVPALVVLIA